jgi:hypothetical protein
MVPAVVFGPREERGAEDMRKQILGIMVVLFLFLGVSATALGDDRSQGLQSSKQPSIRTPPIDGEDHRGCVSVCHVPPGSPDIAHTICVGANAVDAHLASGDTLGPCEDIGEEFAGNVAGVFLGTATGLGEPIHFLVTLERDGIFTSSDSTDFGVGGIGGFDSDQHGTWGQTGEQQITALSLFFNHDTATGELVAVARNTSIVDFDTSFTDGTGSITVEVFAPFQVLDPLDPNTEEDPLGGVVVVDVTLKRLSIDDDGS